MAYVILFLIISGLLLLSTEYKRINSLFFIIIGTVLAGFSMFRYGVGVDYFSYIDFFNLIGAGKNTYMEPGFVYIIKFVHYIGGTFQVVFAITSLIFIFFYMNFIVGNSRLPALSIFLFLTLPPLYLASFNGIRQFLAVAIFAYSIRYIIDKSFVKFLLFILLGSSFHVTILLMLPLYFVLRKRLTAVHIGLLIVCFVILMQSVNLIIPLIGISPRYLIPDLQNNSDSSPIAFLLILVSLTSIIFRSKFTNPDSTKTNVFINLIFFGALVAMAPMFLNIQAVLITRMTSYFTFSLLFLIPEYVLLLKKNKLHILLLLLILLLGCGYYFYDVFTIGYKVKLMPYNFNFNLFNNS